MVQGNEEDSVTDFTWVVPHKFYSLSKIKAYVRDYDGYSVLPTMPGFELTFSADPTKTSGWDDIVQTFGNTDTGYTALTFDLSFCSEIVAMATCVDNFWSGTDPPYAELERFKF